MAAAPIQPLAWEPPYAAGVALKRQKDLKKKKKRQKASYPTFSLLLPTHHPPPPILPTRLPMIQS